VFGAWTNALHALASTQACSAANASVPVHLQGPYGYNWAEPACERLLMDGVNNCVALVAGGVGIAPFSSLISFLVETAPQALVSLKVRLANYSEMI
jgi:predicted ferric reductase